MKSLERFYPLILIVITIASLWFAWVGWLDSDDKRHVVEGIGWYEQFPYVGPLHPSLRHPIVFPLGMSFRLFGIKEVSVILPNLLYYAGLLAVTFVFLARFTNRHIAFITGIHVCLGASLSRIEGRIALGRFVQRFPNLAANGPRRVLPLARFRGYAEFPIKV